MRPSSDTSYEDALAAWHEARAALERAEGALREAARREGRSEAIAGLDEPDDALMAQRELMETLVHHAPATFVYVDEHLVYRWNNRAHCEVLGKPREAIIGRPAVVVAPGIVSRTEGLLRAALERGEVGRLSGIAIRHEAEQRDAHWDLRYVPVPGPSGRPMGVLVVGAEVTDRVRSERLQGEQIVRLQEIDRLKDNFLGIVSHELRTPLNAVTGFGSMLAEGLVGDLTAPQLRYVDKMLEATDALMVLINDLLDMSRIQAGKFRVSPAPMRLADVAAQVTGRLRALLDGKGHTLSVAIADDLPALHADAQRIDQVLTNLLSNAIKFTPTGGRLALRAVATAGAVRVEVADTGPGITEVDLSRLFMPFTQLDMSATRDFGGTGLGLSICKGLVEAHGGAIGVASTPGEGSTFWFTLPSP